MVCGCGLAYPVLNTDQVCAVVRTVMNIMDGINCGESFTDSIITNLLYEVCSVGLPNIGRYLFSWGPRWNNS